MTTLNGLLSIYLFLGLNKNKYKFFNIVVGLTNLLVLKIIEKVQN